MRNSKCLISKWNVTDVFSDIGDPVLQVYLTVSCFCFLNFYCETYKSQAADREALIKECFNRPEKFCFSSNFKLVLCRVGIFAQLLVLDRIEIKQA